MNCVDPSGNMTLADLQTSAGIAAQITKMAITVGRVFQIYRRISAVIDLIDFGVKAARVMAAMLHPEPGAIKNAVLAEVQNSFGPAGIQDMASGFDAAFHAMGSYQTQITRAIVDNADDMAAQIAGPLAARLPTYAALASSGRLKFVIFAPTGPGPRASENYINITKSHQLAVSPFGGRLFGFGVRTSAANVDQILRVDYWDVRPGLLNPLHLHYHIFGDKGHNDPRRTLWKP